MADDRPRYSFDPGPPPEASRYLAHKRLRPSFSWRDVEPEEHAVAFAVAKATQLDVLATIRDEVQRAIDKGVPFAQFQKELRPRLEAQGWWGKSEMVDPATGQPRQVRLGSPRRLKTIYEANVRSARAAGQWERIQRTKRALPYLQYNLGPSIEHRPEHEARAGLVLPVDDPSWDTWYPPNGWGCKCWVRALTRAEGEDLGVAEAAPESPAREVRNKRTGVVSRVPVGIDPGWERNPGKLRAENAARFMADRFEEADELVARAAARDMRQSWAVSRLMQEARQIAATKEALSPPLKGPALHIPIGVLPARAKNALRAERRGVIFSGDTAVKQAVNHPEIVQDDYAWLEPLLEQGEMRRTGERSVAFVEPGTETPWIAVVKALPGGENFLQSLFRVASSRYYRRQILSKPAVPEE